MSGTNPDVNIERADLTLALTHRERDTIIAALRAWQHRISTNWALMKGDQITLLRRIARNDRQGVGAMMSPAEIDALIETRINR